MNHGLPVADERFNVAAKIDILIGAGVFFKLLQPGQLSLSPERPMLQQTVFGWVVAGEYQTERASDNTTQCLVAVPTADMEEAASLNELVAKFWEL